MSLIAVNAKYAEVIKIMKLKIFMNIFMHKKFLNKRGLLKSHKNKMDSIVFYLYASK